MTLVQYWSYAFWVTICETYTIKFSSVRPKRLQKKRKKNENETAIAKQLQSFLCYAQI